MSSWITLNVVTDDSNELVEDVQKTAHKAFKDTPKVQEPVVVFPNGDYDHVKGIDVILYTFTTGAGNSECFLEEYVRLCAESEANVELIVGITANDTIDSATLQIFSPTDQSIIYGDKYSGEILGGVYEPASIHEYEEAGHSTHTRQDTPSVFKKIKEAEGVWPTVGGSYY